MRKYKDLAILPLLFLGVLGIFALNWRFSFTDGAYNMMGGESTVGAIRVLQGEIPYRDFWTLYAPGHFYLLALLFSLFGTHLLVEVVAAGVLCTLAICICYGLLRTVTQNLLLALAGAGILFAALLESRYYYFRLETYPPTVLLIFISLLLIVYYYQTDYSPYLIFSGVATGIIAIFKHDVGAYTAIAIGVGLIVHHLVGQPQPFSRWRTLLVQLLLYGTALLAIVLPVVIYFATVAGADAWHDMIIFPLTDWRYARPESYPGLFDFDFQADSLSAVADKVFAYVKFAAPFLLNWLGLLTIGLAIKSGKPFYAALGTTFGLAFWLHYSGAQLQINTHIVTMSIYAALTTVLFSTLLVSGVSRGQRFAVHAAMLLVLGGWLFALAARPTYDLVRKQFSQTTVEMKLARVSGFRVMPFEAAMLNALAEFVDKNVEPDQYLYIGLNRHDSVVVSEIMSYFVFNRPIPVRYHELHPAVVDHIDAQDEMVADLEVKQPPFVLIRSMFTDDVLDQVKVDFQRHLPGVGATALDHYLSTHYTPVAEFPPYRVAARKN